MTKKSERFTWRDVLLFGLLLACIFVVCVCIGSVTVSPEETFRVVWQAITGRASSTAGSHSIIVAVRIPRVICVALVGASLSLCGAAMQGLLRNPLADGSTLGVSSGASLGAAVAIAFGINIPGLPGSGSMALAIVFAFVTLMAVLVLAYKLDYTLSTNTIILIGIVFSMFTNSLISLVITFAGEKVKHIVFWTMGSLAGSTYRNALTLLVVLVLCSILILRYAGEMNAFSFGEDNARNIGINVRRVKLLIMVAVSVLIGVCVSIGGAIGFVGLVIPHIARMITGPNHHRLLPASLFFGACFLMLADLCARVLLRPLELPIGVVTSMVGAVVFISIFYTTRKVR